MRAAWTSSSSNVHGNLAVANLLPVVEWSNRRRQIG